MTGQDATCPTVSERPAVQSSRVLFLTGVGRSGTTAMAMLLNAHPHICLGMERYKLKFLRGSRFEGNEFTQERFFDFQPGDTNILPGLSSRWRILYEQIALKLSGARIVGDKIPHLFDKFDECSRVFPEARWIYMLRGIDGVASSWNARAKNPSDKWPESNDFRMAVQTWNAGNRVINALPADRLRIVSYEDFFGNDSDDPGGLMEFMGIDDDDAFRAAVAASRKTYAEVVSQKAPVILEGQEAFIEEHADMETYRALRARVTATPSAIADFSRSAPYATRSPSS